MSDEPPRTATDDAIDAVRANPCSEAAWHQFYRCVRPTVAAVLFRLGVRDPSDMTQEVFRHFLGQSPWHHDWSTLPASKILIGYVSRIARNLVISSWRAAAVRPREESVDNLDLVESSPLHLDSDDLLERLQRKLTQPERDLLNALVNGLSLGEIAAAHRISYDAAGVRVHRLKRRVERLLQQLW
jgi:DNA-directed RNA polymerase specialized sigma24 family protein